MSVTDLPQVPFDRFDLHLFASDRGPGWRPRRTARSTASSSTFIPGTTGSRQQTSRPFFEHRLRAERAASCPGRSAAVHIRASSPVCPTRWRAPSATSPAAGSRRWRSVPRRPQLHDAARPDRYLRGIIYCPEAAIAAAAQERLGRVELAQPELPGRASDRHHQRRGRARQPIPSTRSARCTGGPVQGRAALSLVAITPGAGRAVRLRRSRGSGGAPCRSARPLRSAAVSDTVPSIIGGVPIRMRSIQVNIDKPNFMINPTNCAPFPIDSQGIGDQGTVADFSSYFHAVNCAPWASSRG